MKVLITGGAGYIGTELTHRLSQLKEVESIVIYDNLSRGNYNLFIGKQSLPSNKISFVKGDLLDSRKLKKEMKDSDVIYHLAARVTTPFADQNTHQFEQNNHWGTAETVYAVEENPVKKFIYLSSVSVYGSGTETVNHLSPVKPDTYYGSSKLRGEEHVNRLMEKMNTYIIRCGNVYGYSKSMRFDAVINKFMFEANFSNKIIIKGDGEQNRAFIHINQAVESLVALLTNELPSGTFNLVDQNYSIRDITLVLKEIYPDLEMSFVDQHLKLREIMVNRDERLALIQNFSSESSLKTELELFKKSFTF